MKSLSRARLFATPWIVADQTFKSMGFSRQEYWSGLPFPYPGDLPNPGIEPGSPALEADALTSMLSKSLIQFSVDGHLGHFHVLAIVNGVAMNIGVCMSFSVLVSSGYMPRSGIDGSYGGFIPSFF